MNGLRYILGITALLITSTATAQDNVHKTLDKWRYPEPPNCCTIKYTEEDYYLFIADSLKHTQESRKQLVPNRQSSSSNGKEPPKEQHSSEKAATSFYLKEY